jgi:hypothetical protein
MYTKGSYFIERKEWNVEIIDIATYMLLAKKWKA